jgi:phosphoglycerol transferase MdoB-like AlkP superfamily enzyme
VSPVFVSSLRRWLTLVGALLLLNASLSFHNIWPTPAIGWRGELSIELAVVLLMMIAARRWFAPPSRTALRWMTAIWVMLVIGHYADVTTPALYGRDINLYWDLRYMPDVAAMVVRAAPLRLIVLATMAVVLIIALLYLTFRWSLGRVGESLADSRARRWIGIVAASVLVVFAGQQLIARFSSAVYTFEPAIAFATPVTQTYARQARLVIDARSGAKSLAASPPMDGDLALVQGADVFLVFIESYGATSYERQDIASPLGASRALLDAAIRDTNRGVVSAYVESPTFGGSSWLAHLSLMSGVEVRDAASNASLMTQKRETMVTAFARHGYRTVALMPGLRQRWPEGAFYGFDDVYGAARLDYRGPEFGWFAVPDQFSLARFETLERSQPSQSPLFLFFPTISTHFPFSPTPPYQSDWARMLTNRPYDGRAIVDAYAHEPDWISFGPGYVNAIAYTYATLGGYLRATADRDRILILLGDHQPAAAVSGEGAPWDVPVHVIVRTGVAPDRSRILDRLVARGFRRGLTPQRPSLGHMHSLLPVLLDAFSGAKK